MPFASLVIVTAPRHAPAAARALQRTHKHATAAQQRGRHFGHVVAAGLTPIRVALAGAKRAAPESAHQDKQAR
ncbi:hypothetical protein [Variovorax paradoxus]|uniref:hypothetical protein n=1 Tax=Variovorax paradoxus TaxID=34073 RepID=UPI0019348788|nr:hypothetical protein INQ48_14300 [Variovorax paradoxus]